MNDLAEPKRSSGGVTPIDVQSLVSPLTIWFSTGAIVFVAVQFSLAVVQICERHPDHRMRMDLPSAMAAWDGQWQIAIIRHDYQRKVNQQDRNPAAFLPLYPLVSGIIARIGIREETALLFVSNGSFLAMLVCVNWYLLGQGLGRSRAACVLVLIAISPYSHFFRMAYTESLFCMLVAFYFLAAQRGWTPLALSLIVAAAIASRIVGVVLLPLLFVDIGWRFSGKQRWAKAIAAVFIGMAGLVYYMLHLQQTQGDPLAVFNAQQGWTIRGDAAILDRTLKSAIGVPLLDAYRDDCVCHWQRTEPRDLPLFNMQFVNPIVIMVTGTLIFLGWRGRILSKREIYYCAMVVAVPYFSQGYRICLHSQSRYALAAFPVAIVVAWGLARLPPWYFSVCCGISAVLLFGNAALFVGWYYNY